MFFKRCIKGRVQIQDGGELSHPLLAESPLEEIKLGEMDSKLSMDDITQIWSIVSTYLLPTDRFKLALLSTPLELIIRKNNELEFQLFLLHEYATKGSLLLDELSNELEQKPNVRRCITLMERAPKLLCTLTVGISGAYAIYSYATFNPPTYSIPQCNVLNQTCDFKQGEDYLDRFHIYRGQCFDLCDESLSNIKICTDGMIKSLMSQCSRSPVPMWASLTAGISLWCTIFTCLTQRESCASLYTSWNRWGINLDETPPYGLMEEKRDFLELFDIEDVRVNLKKHWVSLLSSSWRLNCTSMDKKMRRKTYESLRIIMSQKILACGVVFCCT